MLNEYQVDIPEGKSGNWEVKKFTVSEEAAKMSAMRAAFQGSRRFVPAGTYTGIFRGGNVIMSDTPDEICDHLTAIRKAHGHCLVNGLGIGMVAAAMLAKPEVTKVTVIELSQDVINLTGPSLKAKFGDKVEIIQADAMTHQPPKGVKYGAVWHDIFDNICADNLEQMKALHRKYGRRAEWQGSWCRAECEVQAERDRSWRRGRMGINWSRVA